MLPGCPWAQASVAPPLFLSSRIFCRPTCGLRLSTLGKELRILRCLLRLLAHLRKPSLFVTEEGALLLLFQEYIILYFSPIQDQSTANKRMFGPQHFSIRTHAYAGPSVHVLMRSAAVTDMGAWRPQASPESSMAHHACGNPMACARGAGGSSLERRDPSPDPCARAVAGAPRGRRPHGHAPRPHAASATRRRSPVPTRAPSPETPRAHVADWQSSRTSPA